MNFNMVIFNSTHVNLVWIIKMNRIYEFIILLWFVQRIAAFVVVCRYCGARITSCSTGRELAVFSSALEIV